MSSMAAVRMIALFFSVLSCLGPFTSVKAATGEYYAVPLNSVTAGRALLMLLLVTPSHRTLPY